MVKVFQFLAEVVGDSLVGRFHIAYQLGDADRTGYDGGYGLVGQAKGNGDPGQVGGGVNDLFNLIDQAGAGMDILPRPATADIVEGAPGVVFAREPTGIEGYLSYDGHLFLLGLGKRPAGILPEDIEKGLDDLSIGRVHEQLHVVVGIQGSSVGFDLAFLLQSFQDLVVIVLATIEVPGWRIVDDQGIHVIGLQTAQAALQGFADVIGFVVHRPRIGMPEFSIDHDRTPVDPLQGFAEPGLAGPVSVIRGRVVKVDPQVQCFVDHGPGFRLGHGLPAGVCGQLPGTQAYFGDSRRIG